MNVAEPSNVKAPPLELVPTVLDMKMAPPYCEKIREMPHKEQRETITHI